MYRRLITRPVIGWLNLQGLLALAGAAGPIILVISDIVAARSALVASNYDLIRDAISLLAWMPMGWIQTIGFLLIGLMVEMFAAGLFLSIRRRKGFEFGIILLAYFGFGLLLIGAFHTDTTPEPITIDGNIHFFAANTVFLALPVANLLISPSLKTDPEWRPLFPYSIAMAGISLAWMAIYKIWLPADLSWFGLFERILVLTEILWVETMALWSLRLSFLGRAKKMPRSMSTDKLSSEVSN